MNSEIEKQACTPVKWDLFTFLFDQRSDSKSARLPDVASDERNERGCAPPHKAPVLDRAKLNEALVETIALWGRERTIDKCIEECCEMIAALIRYRRGGSADAVAEKIADVSIMVYMVSQVFGHENTGPRWDYKIERLRKTVVSQNIEW